MYETHVTVQGRLVADPVVKQGRDGGAPFTTFRVAQSERHPVRGEPGQWADSEPSFYDVTVFRAPGANAARSLRKGHPVVVHGKLRAEQNRLGRLIAAGKSDDEIITELYLAAVCRPPVAEELAASKDHIGRSMDRRQALEDVAWAVLNSKEFLFQH